MLVMMGVSVVDSAVGCPQSLIRTISGDAEPPMQLCQLMMSPPCVVYSFTSAGTSHQSSASTFVMTMLDRGCHVFSFDPSPGAHELVDTQLSRRYHFFPIGISIAAPRGERSVRSKDAALSSRPEIPVLSGTPTLALSDVMSMLGHRQVNLLRADVTLHHDPQWASELVTSWAAEGLIEKLGQVLLRVPDNTMLPMLDSMSMFSEVHSLSEVVEVGLLQKWFTAVVTQPCIADINTTSVFTGAANIPKVLHFIHTNENRSQWSPKHFSTVSTWEAMLPAMGWRLEFWSAARIQTLLDHPPPELGWYAAAIKANVTVPIQRLDAIRYLILYVHGGMYADVDMRFLDDMSKIFPGAELVLQQWDPLHTTKPVFPAARGLPILATSMGLAVVNALMASVPGHPLWLHVMRTVAVRLSEKWRIDTMKGPRAKIALVSSTTGPFMLGNALLSYHGPNPKVRYFCIKSELYRHQATGSWL
jgi:mannosyltransferase OCH1-like enzyme